jgi:hypothetical protein
LLILKLSWVMIVMTGEVAETISLGLCSGGSFEQPKRPITALHIIAIKNFNFMGVSPKIKKPSSIIKRPDHKRMVKYTFVPSAGIIRIRLWTVGSNPSQHEPHAPAQIYFPAGMNKRFKV